jgi:futalosine hydrolase
VSNVGIIVSTLLEAETLLGIMSPKDECVIQGKRYYQGGIDGKKIVLCICGVSKANAAHGAAILLERFGPSVVYVIGVGGAYPSSGLNIGDIAVGNREVYGDEGLQLEAGFFTMDTIGLPLATLNSVSYYNEFPLHIPAELAGYRQKGAFVTVSSCTGTLRQGREIEKRFNAICENMEGAAVAHICLLNKTPVVEIRGISNIIEDRSEKPLDRTAIVTAAASAQEFFLSHLV